MTRISTTIYYFSATGNTLSIARRMAQSMEAPLIPMAQGVKTPCASERIGLLFPIYFWGLPRTAVHFIRGLPIVCPNPYIFAIATCGGFPGGALGMAENLLNQRGLRLSYGTAIPSVANFIEEYNPRSKSAAARIQRADDMAQKAAGEILCKAENRIPRFSLKDRIFYGIYEHFKLDQDEGFRADGRCTGCGVCARVCPSGNISLKQGKPEFHHRCEHCTACIHWCPQKALQWKRATVKRRRYHHPDIRLEDIVIPGERERKEV